MTNLSRLVSFSGFLAALLVIVLGQMALAAPDNATPATRLNEAQAVQVARAYCQRIGQPVTVPGTVISPDKNEDSAHQYWLPCWQIAFSGQAEVEVVDATGVIAEYSNEAYYILHRGKIPAGEPLPQQEAIQRAKEDVAATGQREPLLFWRVSLDHLTNPPLVETSSWAVWWHRAAGGVAYRDQHIGLSLDAQTGELTFLVLMFPSPPLTAAVRAWNQDDAINAAASRIVSQGIEQEATHSGTELEIIRPDPDQKGVRLAWVSTFVVDGHWRQEFLDAETGEILAEGADGGPAGMHGAGSAKVPAPPPVAPMLQGVRAVALRGRDAQGKWAAKPLLKFGVKDQPHAVATLRKTADFRKEGPAGAAPQQIVLVSKSHAIGVYSYFPDTGLLGSGSEWAAVPDEFKTWVQRKIVSVGASPAPGPRR